MLFSFFLYQTAKAKPVYIINSSWVIAVALLMWKPDVWLDTCWCVPRLILLTGSRAQRSPQDGSRWRGGPGVRGEGGEPLDNNVRHFWTRCWSHRSLNGPDMHINKTMGAVLTVEMRAENQTKQEEQEFYVSGWTIKGWWKGKLGMPQNDSVPYVFMYMEW